MHNTCVQYVVTDSNKIMWVWIRQSHLRELITQYTWQYWYTKIDINVLNKLQKNEIMFKMKYLNLIDKKQQHGIRINTFINNFAHKQTECGMIMML